MDLFKKKQEEPFFLRLPFPKSVNTLYYNKIIGRKNIRVKTIKYRDWIKQSELLLSIQKNKEFTDRVDLNIFCGGGRVNQDISNLIKCVEDQLVRNKTIQDDSKKYVRSVKISWDDNVDGCVVFISNCKDEINTTHNSG